LEGGKEFEVLEEVALIGELERLSDPDDFRFIEELVNQGWLMEAAQVVMMVLSSGQVTGRDQL